MFCRFRVMLGIMSLDRGEIVSTDKTERATVSKLIFFRQMPPNMLSSFVHQKGPVTNFASVGICKLSVGIFRKNRETFVINLLETYWLFSTFLRRIFCMIMMNFYMAKPLFRRQLWNITQISKRISALHAKIGQRLLSFQVFLLARHNNINDFSRLFASHF